MPSVPVLASTAPRTGGETGPASSPFRVGDSIADTYVIRGVLGTGGMGQVYAADDVDLHRPVAIKTALGEGGSHLRREAQALAQVHHRNVVAIHRIGVHDGVPFMVMERLFGRTLAEHIWTCHRRGRPTGLDDAVESLVGIASGLAALHGAGIAHLDLKPGNVMVCAEQRIVLFDLGVMVAEVVAQSRAPCGTPLYMAPELIEGDLAPGRACRADFYSFGALAYELLTGRPVFSAPDPAAMLVCHLLDEPPDPRELRPEIPTRLSALVRACLAKIPDARPEGADEIAWELRSIQRESARQSGPRTTFGARAR